MSRNEIETNNVNGSQHVQQGPFSSMCSQQGNIGVIIMRILSLVREKSGLAKRTRSLWSAIY